MAASRLRAALASRRPLGDAARELACLTLKLHPHVCTGVNVRHRAKEILDLVNSSDRLRDERDKVGGCDVVCGVECGGRGELLEVQGGASRRSGRAGWMR